MAAKKFKASTMMPAMPRGSLLDQLNLLNASDTDVHSSGRNTLTEEDKEMLGFIQSSTKRRSIHFDAPEEESRKPSLTSASHIAGINTMVSPQIELTAKQRRDIGLAFEAFDIQGTGYISTSNLKLAFQAMGFIPEKTEIARIIEIFDPSNTHQLCYSDFITIIEMKISEPDTRENIMRAYNLFDRSENGVITASDLRLVANTLGEDVCDEELEQMIQDNGVEETGTVDRECFYQILKKFTMY